MGNVQDIQSSVTKTLVTEFSLCEALRKARGPGIKLSSWSVRNSTSSDDNYIAVITIIDVNYVLDDEESTVTFIAKLGPPQPTKVLHHSINYAFKKEARAYLELIPSLSSELTSLGMKPLRFPECYYASWEPGKEVLYLQDLTAQGFKSPDRKKGLDVAHSTLVLKELARLHAASLLLEVRDGFEDLDAKYTFLERDCFDITEDAMKQTKEVLNRYIEKAIAILNEFEEYKKVAQWLNRLKPRAFEKMEKKLETHTRFAVVCHGDCWTKNILFRYNKKGVPKEVKLLDLQMIRRASLAVDLNYFMYTSFSPTDRKENLENYLNIYYATFKSIMQARGLAMPFIRSELDHEYKSKNLYGVLWAMVFVPLTSSLSVDIPDWETVDDSLKGKVPIQEMSTDKKMILALKENPEVLDRFLSLFDDVVEGQRGSPKITKTKDIPFDMIPKE